MENKVDINILINEFKAIIADQAHVIAILRAAAASSQDDATQASNGSPSNE
jgi:hypothetical protein